MSRLLKDCPQQHSLPGVLPYDQVESVTLVDAKWTQSVQTPNPVALTEFPGKIWPLLVVFKAADRGMTQEVMICRVKMFCCWWSFKPTVSPVIMMAIHRFVQWTFGFSYVLFVATAARDQSQAKEQRCSAVIQAKVCRGRHNTPICADISSWPTQGQGIVDKNWSIIESLDELRIFTRANQSWLSDAPKAFVISWYEHDSNQTLMMTT